MTMRTVTRASRNGVSSVRALRAVEVGTDSPVMLTESPAAGAIDDFEMWLRSWGAAERTVKLRVGVVRKHLAPMGVPPATGDLAAWLARDDWSPWTRCTFHASARSWCGWLVQAGLADRDPTEGLRAPSIPAGAPRPLSVGEVARVLSVAEGDVRTYVLLGLLAGLRAHEVAKLRGEDVTAEAIHVVGKGGRAASIPTHPDLWALAQTYPASGFWFPTRSERGHVAPTRVSTAVTSRFRRAGVEGSLHRCRHTYGTRLMRSGASLRVVQTLMRHASIATTQRYLAVDEDERAAAIRLLAA